MLSGCNSSTELQWHTADGHYRWASVSPAYFGETGFSSLSATQTNIEFKNKLSREAMGRNRHYLNGSGVTAGDINGDGLADLYFAGLDTPNKLYKNLGNMEFKDITESAGVAHKGYYSTGAVFADIDGDRDLDLLVSAMHKKNVLYINDGTGNFTKKEDSGLGAVHGSMTMALADIEGDGDLDLYIANYKEKSVKDLYTAEELSWNKILKEPYDKQHQTGPFTLVEPFDEHYRLFMSEDNRLIGKAERGAKDELYINKGGGTFRKVLNTKKRFLDAKGQPLGLQGGWGLTAKFQDLNKDGLPDLYVCNDFSPRDRIWINQGGGIFREMKEQAIRTMSFASMAVDFSDINRDRRLDIFVTEMLSPQHQRRLQQTISSEGYLSNRVAKNTNQPQYNRNSLYLKRKDGTYAEIAYYSGLEASGWSWATRFMDINLDGYEDLIINTGYSYDILNIGTQIGMFRDDINIDHNFDVLIDRAPRLHLTNKFLMNTGDLRFTDRSAEWGFRAKDVSHGLASADFDNDGDLDFATNRLNEKALVYENTTTASRISVRLKGTSPNTQGIGARIRLSGRGKTQQRQVTAGGGYLSGSTPTVMFAADPGSDYTLEVIWPNQSVSRIKEVRANRIYEIYQSGAHPAKPKNKDTSPQERPIFTDVSYRIGHRHHEAPFNASNLQPMVPIQLSKLGPGISWIDIDNDKDEDLLIASGKGGSTGAFENMGEGTFKPLSSMPFTSTAPGDQTAILGWKTSGGTHLMVGSANYEQGNPQVPSAYHYRLTDSAGKQTGTISNYSTTGPMSAADYDGDRDVDLFLGGRFVPAHYPRAASSRLFKNENGSFVLDRVNSRKLSEVGLITASVFSDYDRDGDQDLLLSRSWDSILLMENEGGIFNSVSKSVGLDQYKGWWQGITTGDFNNDGRPDIVAANWGLNSFYQLEHGAPLRMYYHDFNGDQRVEIIEAHADGRGHYVPREKLFEYRSVSPIMSRFKDVRPFAHATLRNIFGDRLRQIPYKEINTLRHMLFLNTKKGFKAQPLPKKAQFSIAFHAGVADFNNDGNEDLFLSQNFSGLSRKMPQLNTGRALWLRGDGRGHLKPVPGSESGIKIYGEQRGAAFSDFNSDGRVDLAVSQNDDRTKLYVNNSKRRGYRITLKGPSENVSAIGSAVQLIYQDGSRGPLREIQAGSGYWSQDSFTQILGVGPHKEVAAIAIQWFDGHRQSLEVSADKKSYLIKYPG